MLRVCHNFAVTAAIDVAFILKRTIVATVATSLIPLFCPFLFAIVEAAVMIFLLLLQLIMLEH